MSLQAATLPRPLPAKTQSQLKPIDPLAYDRYLESAIRLKKEGQPAKAIEQLILAVAANPIALEPLEISAEINLDIKKYAAAAADSEKAIKLAPTWPKAYSLHARAMAGLGKKQEAKADIQKLSTMCKEDGNLLAGKALLLMGDSKEAIKYLSRHLQAYPKDTDALAQRASAYKKGEEWWQAIADYAAIMDIRQDLDALYARGYATAELDEYNQAKVDFNSVLQKRPNHIGALLGLGFCNYHLNKQSECQAALFKVLQISPNEADAHYELARSFFREDKADDALKHIEKAISLNPKHADSYNMRGSIYLKRGKKDLATSDFKKAQQIEPDEVAPPLVSDIDLLYYRADFIAHLEDYETAEKELREILKNHPDYKRAQRKLADVLSWEEKYDQAAEAYSKLIATDKNNLDLHEYRGIAFRQSDQIDKAMADFEECRRIKPGYADVYEPLALCYLAKGDIGQAIATAQAGLKLAPNDSALYSCLRDIYIVAGVSADSISVAMKALQLVPNSAFEIDGLANAYEVSGDYDSAWRQRIRISYLVPNDTDYILSMALLFDKMDKVAEAIEQCEIAKTLAPDDPNIAAELGYLLNKSGQSDKARQYFESVIAAEAKKEPKWSGAWADLPIAQAQNGLKKYEEALKTCTRARQRYDGVEYAYNIAFEEYFAHKGLGNFDAAKKALDQCIKSEPNIAGNYILRAELNQQSGKSDLAAADTAKAKELKYESKVIETKSLPLQTDPDFGLYMANLQRMIKRHWAPPKGMESKRVRVTFRVNENGKVSGLRMEQGSGVAEADDAALTAIKNAAPFANLPAGSPAIVDIRFTFDYNVFNKAGSGMWKDSSKKF